MALEIEFDEAAVSSCADELANIQSRLIEIRNSLIALSNDLMRSWTDEAFLTYRGEYNRGIDYMGDMLLAVNTMEEFLHNAVSCYRETEQYVSGL